MTLPGWLRIVYIVLLVVGAGVGWTFIIRYTTTYRWWSTELGRHLMTFSGCLASFETYYLVAIIWPSFPGKDLIRTVLFVILTIAIVWRLVMFERIRRQGNGNGSK